MNVTDPMTGERFNINRKTLEITPMPHPKSAEDLCENCIHWRVTRDSATPNDSEGECRRFPPSPFPVNQGDGPWQWSFPIVRDRHWCGEFEDIRK